MNRTILAPLVGESGALGDALGQMFGRDRRFTERDAQPAEWESVLRAWAMTLARYFYLLPPCSGGFSRSKSASFSRSSRYRRRSPAFFTTGPVWGCAADQARNCSQNTWISPPASASSRSLMAQISSNSWFVIMAQSLPSIPAECKPRADDCCFDINRFHDSILHRQNPHSLI